MTAFYTNRHSVLPGESFTLHASSASSPCRLEVARQGLSREIVFEQAVVEVDDHPTPSEADMHGCGWPACLSIEVGESWRSGYYDIVLTDAGGETTRHFVCVRAAPGRRGSSVLVLTTNTLHAYNYWGGRSAYCDVGALMSRQKSLPEAMAGAIGVLSTERPFPQLLLAAPAEMPRLVNAAKRGFEQKSWAGGDPAWSRRHGQSPL